jgi:hypothetical protein
MSTHRASTSPRLSMYARVAGIDGRERTPPIGVETGQRHAQPHRTGHGRRGWALNFESKGAL